jgi:hypothetical protein
MFHFSSLHAACLAAALALCTPASAEPVRSAAPAPASALFGAPVPATQLEAARGGAAAMAASATLHGAVAGNSASQMVTGANTIASGSFAGAAGIPIVIQNTGANVLIQNTTVINLQLSP